MRAATRATAVARLLTLAGCLGARTESSAPVEQNAAGSWASLAPLPTPRQEVAAAALRGQVWVIGGFSTTGEPLSTVESFDPQSNTWTARAPLPEAVHHAAAVTIDDRLFVLGGYSGGRVRWEPIDSMWEWNDSRNAWEPRPPMPTPRGALAAAGRHGRVHALGGGRAPRAAQRRGDLRPRRQCLESGERDADGARPPGRRRLPRPRVGARRPILVHGDAVRQRRGLRPSR